MSTGAGEGSTPEIPPSVLFLAAESGTANQIDHVGIHLGKDHQGIPRFLFQPRNAQRPHGGRPRRRPDPPTPPDGSDTYATTPRVPRRG
ncbi:hypothetical protein [Streptomyces albipurpureus]|uniref:Transposase n=1 Tax=Streptomyces albipurpureus TaxID=2897419 RepID=A0ABT0V0G5_9ACTN|nr:hypothetical protein [Streptomyces sp. CWNU-1]MCM2393981.1 hypothetical protein [Streptomyces sp. CWNU-1]